MEKNKNNNLNEIEEMLVKKIAWYMDDAIDFKEKKEKINVDLGVNKMIGNVIAIEALKERAKNISNTTTDINRKIKRFGG
ncbi:MAG: hypothetical protein IKW53_04935 [Clostridia bacterium]|nr:hypothetical protein [Clostridia bacterium]